MEGLNVNVGIATKSFLLRLPCLVYYIFATKQVSQFFIIFFMVHLLTVYYCVVLFFLNF